MYCGDETTTNITAVVMADTAAVTVPATATSLQAPGEASSPERLPRYLTGAGVGFRLPPQPEHLRPTASPYIRHHRNEFMFGCVIKNG